MFRIVGKVVSRTQNKRIDKYKRKDKNKRSDLHSVQGTRAIM